jgi:hypothetical protein
VIRFWFWFIFNFDSWWSFSWQTPLIQGNPALPGQGTSFAVYPGSHPPSSLGSQRYENVTPVDYNEEEYEDEYAGYEEDEEDEEEEEEAGFGDQYEYPAYATAGAVGSAGWLFVFCFLLIIIIIIQGLIHAVSP